MSRMKICFIIPKMHVGGAERVIVELSRGLKARGHQVTVVSEGGAFADLLVQEEIAHHTLPNLPSRHPRAILKSALRFRDILRELRPDVINPHAWTVSVVAALACRLAGIRPKRCFTLHNPEQQASFYIIGPTLAHLADDVSTVCAFSLRVLHDHGLPRPIGHVIYNGIDRSWLRAVDEIEARPLPGERLPVRIGILSRLIESKGHRFLLEALARLKAEGDTRCVLEIAGDGPYRAELEALVAAKGLTDQVHFHGVRKDAAAFLDSIDVFALPSLLEALPMSVLEAMARGTPVLCSTIGGCPEIVREGETGFVFPPGDTDALLQAIKRLLDRPETVRRMRGQARDLVERQFLTEHMVDGYERWFTGILEPGRGAVP